jgi:hypothetical protein
LLSAAIVGAALAAVIVSNIVLIKDIFGSGAVISSLQIIRVDHPTQKLQLLLLQLPSIVRRIIQVIIAIFILYTIIIIVYFLGYFRFEAPVVFSTQDTSTSSTVAAAQKRDDVKSCSDCNSNNNNSSSSSSSSISRKKKKDHSGCLSVIIINSISIFVFLHIVHRVDYEQEFSPLPTTTTAILLLRKQLKT